MAEYDYANGWVSLKDTDPPTVQKDDTAPLCRSYTGKPNIAAAISKYSIVLHAINEVHNKALVKYTPYSWLLDPDNRDSSLSDNLNAYYRHYAAHLTGNTIDDDGLPHTHHMCTRIAMAVVCASIPRPTKEYTGEPLHTPLAYIMPPVVMALAKEKLVEENTDRLVMISDLNSRVLSLLANCSDGYPTLVPDMKSIHPLEELLIATFRFTLREL